MKGKHWAILAGAIAAVALQLSGIEHWAEASSPKFVAGLLAQLGVVLTAMFSEKPTNGAPPDGSLKV